MSFSRADTRLLITEAVLLAASVCFGGTAMLEAKLVLSFIWDVLRLRGCMSRFLAGLVVVVFVIVVYGLFFVK
jgi:hypothetical protein